MTSVLPIDFVLEKRPQAHGYTVLETGTESPFLDKGVIIKGHEFHYSRPVINDELQPMAYHMSRGHGIDGKGDGIVYKNVLAAYTHLHALGTPEWSAALVKKAREYRKSRQAA
jgi:cobyrinic acid a,c-diamide synthase